MDKDEIVSELASVIRAYRETRVDPSAIASKCLQRLDQIGLCIVPREPTPAMLDVGNWDRDNGMQAEEIYTNMVRTALTDSRIEDAGPPKIPVLRIEGLDE